MRRLRAGKAKNFQKALIAIELLCVTALLYLYFSPWVSSMGEKIPAPGLAERLEGLHRLAGFFSVRSQISVAYELAQKVYFIPLLSALAGVFSFVGVYSVWGSRLAGIAGIAAGGVTLYAVDYVGDFIAGKWFHHLEYGATYSQYPAIILIVAGGFRLIASRR